MCHTPGRGLFVPEFPLCGHQPLFNLVENHHEAAIILAYTPCNPDLSTSNLIGQLSQNYPFSGENPKHQKLHLQATLVLDTYGAHFFPPVLGLVPRT